MPGPAPRQHVCIAGAGTMGAGIAIVFARAHWHVQLVARRQAALDDVAHRIDARLRRLLECRALTNSDAAAIPARIKLSLSLEPLAKWDLVVESIVEDLPSKKELLARLEANASEPDTIITSNTSSLSIDALADGLQRPGRFAGLHWLNPPELIDVVEAVSGSATDAETLTRVSAWCEEIGKTCIRLTRETPGFVINRLQYALLREAFALVESGVCSYEQIDAAVTHGLGARWAGIGPFESLDLGGLDVHAEVARGLFPVLSSESGPADAVVELVSEGALGCKTSRGLYGDYDSGDIDALVRKRNETLATLTRLRATTVADIASSGDATGEAFDVCR